MTGSAILVIITHDGVNYMACNVVVYAFAAVSTCKTSFSNALKRCSANRLVQYFIQAYLYGNIQLYIIFIPLQ